ARTLMRQMAKMSVFERIKMMTGLGKMGAFQPGAKLMKNKIGTGHRKSAKERAEDRKKKRKQDRRGQKKKNTPLKKGLVAGRWGATFSPDLCGQVGTRFSPKGSKAWQSGFE